MTGGVGDGNKHFVEKKKGSFFVGSGGGRGEGTIKGRAEPLPIVARCLEELCVKTCLLHEEGCNLQGFWFCFFGGLL